MEVEQRISVGRSYSEGRVYSINHPRYRQFSDLVSERTRELAVERGVSRASARSVLLGVSLLREEAEMLIEAYPEFAVSVAGNARPGHAYWVAYRRMANEWLMEQADKYSSSIAHLGGSLASYLLNGRGSSAVLLYDLSQPVAVHERYATVMEAHGVYEDYMTKSKLLGRPIDHTIYERYLRGDGVKFHTGVGMMPQCEVLLVDLLLASYSPMQVASMMRQAGASMAFGFFPYHPSMMFEDEGVLPNTGVRFRREGDRMIFQYPEGAAGVTDYGAHTWASWLVGHTFSLGKGAGASWYQLELMHNRDHLMFFRMVSLEVPPTEFAVSHALDTGMQDYYVVSSWKLRRLGADPSQYKSWQMVPVVVQRRVVDRLYQFAMQLSKEQFTRYALRKQVSLINDRITLEGTTVHVQESLPVNVVNSLVVSVYSRAFVDRYATSQLSSEALSVVKSVAAFASASTVGKIGYIMWVCMQTAYDSTLGIVGHAIRNASDHVRDVMNTGLPRMEAAISEVPPYMLISDAAKGLNVPTQYMGLIAVENSRKAAMAARGFGSRWVRAFAALSVPRVTREYVDYKVETVDLDVAIGARGPAADAAVAAVAQEIGFEEPVLSRTGISAQSVVRVVKQAGKPEFEPVADPVEVLNRLHSAAFPGVAEQDLDHDTASIVFDPQDRFLTASRMVMPKVGDAPVSREYYKSRIKALNVPKRQQTFQELLSAIAARNLNAPQVSLPQDDAAMAREVWENFLTHACVSDARELLAKYRADPVSLTEEEFRNWASQSGPDKLVAVKKEFEDAMLFYSEMSVSDYLVMLKADAKPPLSTKPLNQRIEPQVIVYHRKALSALFSSVFRVLVRRFLSLLLPQYHVNLLKDTRDIEGFLQAVHPFRDKTLRYLENDFSKYDKSQGRFVFELESMIFEELGMNEDMLAKWLAGHVKCKMRAVSMAMSLEVWYQRKSGDATTAFGNVVLNCLAVTYAYKGTDVVWALFMGDDSLVCCRTVLGSEEAPTVMAEVFNLGAKFYITTSPYFASNFVFLDNVVGEVALVPDPVKRAERWSMSTPADNPMWQERYQSALDSMQSYFSVMNHDKLVQALAERYGIQPDVAKGVGAAVATCLRTFVDFRGIWEEFPEMSNY